MTNDLTRYIGDTWRFDIRFYNNDDTVMDLTDIDILFILLNNKTKEVIYTEETDSVTVSKVDLEGKVLIKISRDLTEKLKKGNYPFFIRFKHADNSIETQLRNNIKALPIK